MYGTFFFIIFECLIGIDRTCEDDKKQKYNPSKS